MHWNRAPSRTAVLILAIGILGYSSAWADDVPIEDAIDREYSVFNNNMGQVVIDDAASREVSIHNQTGMIPIVDAFSREFSLFNNMPPPGIADAVSREFTVFNNPDQVVAIGDAASREFVVFNNPDAGIPITDAMSREFTAYSYESVIPAINDASSREYSVWNLLPAGAEETRETPTVLTLLPARPNPFTRKTALHFGLPSTSKVDLSIYDVAGRRVMTVLDGAARPAGWHSVEIDGTGLANGFYFYRISTDREVRKGTFVIRR